MKDNKPHIDNLFKEKLDSRSFDFDDKQWDKMAAILDRQKRWGRITWLSSLAILITAGTFIAYNSTTPNSEISNLSKSNEIHQEIISTESVVESKEEIIENQSIPSVSATSMEVSNNKDKEEIAEDRNDPIDNVIDEETIIENQSTAENTLQAGLATSDDEIDPANDSNETLNQESLLVENTETDDDIVVVVPTVGTVVDESADEMEDPIKTTSTAILPQQGSNELDSDEKQAIQQERPVASESNSNSNELMASNEEVSNTSSIAIQNEELATIDNWAPLTLKTLENPSIEQSLIQPEAQTTEPYSTYVNKAYKLTYGIRGGVGLTNYKNSTEGNGSSNSTAFYVSGFGAFQLQRRVLVEAGFGYSYQNLAMNTKIYHNISYDFFQRDLQEQLFVNQLHILEVPISVIYKLNPNHLLSFGARLNYLMAVEGEKVSTEIYGSQITPLQTEKFSNGKGILNEMNWSLGVAYDYQFNHLFRIGLGADIGLNDWKNEGAFDDNNSFNNNQLRLRVTYLIKN